VKLRIVISLILWVCCTQREGFAQNAEFPNPGTLYDGRLHKIELLLNSDSLIALFHSDNRWTNHSYPANFIYDERDTIKMVGVRIKGNSSRNAIKQSLKIDIDEFRNITYQGLKTFNLNGNHNDPSMSREFLSAQVMFRSEIASLRANSVKLFINGTYYGLYTHAEQVNKQFLESRFGNNNGNLYKCSWPADLSWIDGNQNSYKSIINQPILNERAYDLKTNEKADDYSNLVALIRTINKTPDANFKQAIDTIFEVSSYLKTLAAEVLIGHWDNYFFNKNNYYLYHNPVTKKFTYLPYDMDNTFGVQWGVSNINNRNIHDWGNLSGAKSPLTYRILAVPEFKIKYENYLRTLIDSVFNEQVLFPVLDSMKIILANAVESDPYFSGKWPSDYGYTIKNWENSYNSPIDDHATFGLKPYISDRVKSARSQFLFKPNTSEIYLKDELKIYPVPAAHSIFVTGNGGFNHYKITNSMGIVIVEGEFKNSFNEICTDVLSNGIYHLTLDNNHESKRLPFVIVKN
jgi:spore coat protein H